MADVVVETVKEKFHHLKTKLVSKNNQPQTIIGAEYLWDHEPILSEQNRPHLPEIQKIYADEEAGEGVVTVAYGPSYRAWESHMWKKAKEASWKHVLSNSSGRDEKANTLLYLEAVGRVFHEAKALYKHDDQINRVSTDEFIWMMVIDGCFLLQVALLVLGREKKMKHLLNHPVFGELEGDKVSMIRGAVSSMFVVGNQIPLVVLNELMGQSFFKNVVNGGIWEQPLDLERWVLFELLLVPAMLDARGGGGGATVIPNAALPDYSLYRRHKGNPLSILSCSIRLIISLIPFAALFRRKKAPLRKANDLLHGLWLLVTGLSHSKEDDGIDMEYVYAGEDDSTSRSVHFYDVVLPTVRSATELKKVGIIFKHNEGTSIDGIRFQKVMLSSCYLVLPRVLLDSEKHLFMLFSNLIRYEVTHFGQSKRKVCEYLQLMRELVRTTDDAKVLAANGIIVVDPNLEEKVPLLFQELPIPQVMRSHGGSLRKVRDELTSYTRPSPFKKLGEVLSIVVFLTLLQTVYTVLTFHLRN